MIIHKTKSGAIVLVEVEDITKKYFIPLQPLGDENDNWLAYERFKDDREGYTVLGLPRGELTILGTLSDITEEQAAEIVERVKDMRPKGESFIDMTFELQDVGYADYVTEGHYFNSALDSLRSLIESYKLNPDKVVIIKKG